MHKEPALRSIVRTECGTDALVCDVIKDVWVSIATIRTSLADTRWRY